jgi:hypothetical protein
MECLTIKDLSLFTLDDFVQVDSKQIENEI